MSANAEIHPGCPFAEGAYGTAQVEYSHSNAVGDLVGLKVVDENGNLMTREIIVALDKPLSSYCDGQRVEQTLADRFRDCGAEITAVRRRCWLLGSKTVRACGALDVIDSNGKVHQAPGIDYVER